MLQDHQDIPQYVAVRDIVEPLPVAPEVVAAADAAASGAVGDAVLVRTELDSVVVVG